MTKVIAITKAEYKGNFMIELQFSDDSMKVVDFKSFLEESKNPMTKKYLVESNFKKFRLAYGDQLWGDYEMCFPIWDLYTGKISE